MNPATPTTWTIGSLLNWTEQFFRDRGIESPRLDAQVLLAHALNCRRTDLYVRYEIEPGEQQKATFRELVKQRAAGKPVAYLVGTKEFYLLDFVVTPAVLIPRPATETLVMAGLAAIKANESPRVLDLGTGSGCIAVAIAVNHPAVSVVATDVSQEAIALATNNAKRHNVESRIRFAHGDLYEAIDSNAVFDVIVSNPPYIPTADIASLMPSVKDFEPVAALDGGPNGFAVIRRVIAGAGGRLKPGGRLMLEVGAGQAESVVALFKDNGFSDVRVQKDSDGISRVISGMKPINQ